MAEQLLTNWNAPKINGIAARRVLTPTLLENIYQGQIEGDERGITQRFTINDDLKSAQIRVIRVKPTKQSARELGADINGQNKPAGSKEVETAEVGIDILTVLDTPIDLVNVNMDMIPVDLLKAKVKDYGDQVNLNINAMTIAGKVAKTWQEEMAGNEVNQVIIDTSEGSTDIQFELLNANSLLDDGDEEHDIAMFPRKGRCFVFQAKYRPYLFKKGVLVLGGANTAYELLAKGVLSQGATPSIEENGYVGDFDGVPVHLASKQVWNLACEYLGLPHGALNNLMGYVSSYYANARGVYMPQSTEVVKATTFRGVTILPLTRMGFETWYAKGNVLIFDTINNGFTNAFAEIKGLTGVVEASLRNKAPASRSYPSVSITALSTSSITATASGQVALGYYNTTLKEEADSVAYNGDFTSLTSGSATSGTFTAGNYVVVIAVASDGTQVKVIQKVTA